MSALHDRYELSFEPRDGYLYAYIKADKIDHTIALEYLGEVWAHAADVRAKQILLERDVTAALPLKDVDSTFSEIGKLGAGVRMAFVNRRLPPEPSLQHFIELNIATGADYKYFDTVREAENWLRTRAC